VIRLCKRRQKNGLLAGGGLWISGKKTEDGTDEAVGEGHIRLLGILAASTVYLFALPVLPDLRPPPPIFGTRKIKKIEKKSLLAPNPAFRAENAAFLPDLTFFRPKKVRVARHFLRVSALVISQPKSSLPHKFPLPYTPPGA
jgi:hypothetical protein